jgi:hypothetical protein
MIRNHAIAGVTHMVDVNGNGDECDRNPRQRREQIDDEIPFKRLSRHNHLRPAYPIKKHQLFKLVPILSAPPLPKPSPSGQTQAQPETSAYSPRLINATPTDIILRAL